MGWALTVDGRVDPGGILMLIEDREEAESIAHEIRRNGTRIVIRPYPSGGFAAPRPNGHGGRE